MEKGISFGCMVCGRSYPVMVWELLALPHLSASIPFPKPEFSYHAIVLPPNLISREYLDAVADPA